MIRKTFLLGAAALAATVSLPGRAGPVPATVDKPVTITFYNYNLATAGLGADGTRKLGDRKSNRMSTSMAHVWGVSGMHTGDCWVDFSKPVARDFSV